MGLISNRRYKVALDERYKEVMTHVAELVMSDIVVVHGGCGGSAMIPSPMILRSPPEQWEGMKESEHVPKSTGYRVQCNCMLNAVIERV
jgi:hypothetical protein